MHRLISLFPEGGPGAGLILLRLAVMTCLLAQAAPAGLDMFAVAVDLAIAVLATLLLIGLLMRTTALLCCLMALLAMQAGAAAGILHALAFALASMALLLLGPGAYSVDARLFGRRVLRRPH